MYDRVVIAECRAEADRLRQRLRTALGYGAGLSPASFAIAQDVDRKMSGLDRQLEAITTIAAAAPADGEGTVA